MNCTTCASSAIDRYLFTAVGEVLKCSSCHTVFLSPERRETPPESLYSQEYFTEREPYFFHDGVVDGSARESPHIADFRSGMDLIDRHGVSRGALLDVGCATGSFLSLAKARGWECRGVEVSSFAAEQARGSTGCDIFCGILEDAPFDDRTFDVITMWDLLEHLPVPLRGLEKARQLLKPSGLLLVNTPNENSLLRHVARLLYRGSGGRIAGPVNRLYHHYHLYYFAADALSLLFRQAGFELVVMKTKPIPMSRGRISPATKVVMKTLSVAERLLQAEYELLVLAKKPDDAVEGTATAAGASESLRACEARARVGAGS